MSSFKKEKPDYVEKGCNLQAKLKFGRPVRLKKRAKSGKIMWCRETLPVGRCINLADVWKIFCLSDCGGMEKTMKRQKQRHQHNESFSVLLIPNTGGKSRQFHVTRSSLRLYVGALIIILLAAAGAAAWTTYQFSGPKSENSQATQQKEKIQALEAQVQTLEQEKETLLDEIETLQTEAVAVAEADPAGEAKAENVPEKDTSIPRRYPYTGISTVLSDYSAEQPYLSLNTNADGNVVATGDGMVVTVESDDTYAHIIEVEHNNGYKTRYLCRQEAQTQMQVGAQVQAGDILLTVLTDDTQLDYQILFEGEAIDPLTVFEAKG